jgi:phosphoserine phosphatase
MHHALVFSTSKHSFSDGDAASWLDDLADDYTFLHPLDAPYWLHQGYAAELLCQPDDGFEARNLQHNEAFQTLRRHAADKQLDVNIVPANRRRKQILIADMDSTIITSESLDDLAALAGLGDAVTTITKRAMAGEIDFEGALFERVSMLAGKSSRLFDQLIATATPASGAVELVHTMRANGAKCYLVSGGFDVITGPVAARCGFHDHHANHMYVRDNKIVGTVQTPVLDRHAKAAYLAHYCKQNGIDPIDATTIGDGANDLAMLQAAGMGVAFKGKPLLLAKVAIQLNHSDLRGLLYLQGYKGTDFITDKI